MRRANAVLFLLALAGMVACRGAAPPAKAAAAPPPLPSDVRQVAPESPAASPGAGAAAAADASAASGVLKASGEFVAAVRSELVAKVGGRVANVRVDQGARVHKGQVLLELESDYLRLEVQRAVAESERTAAAAADAQREFERKKELIARGSVTQAVHDKARAVFEQATAVRQAADAALALARQHVADAALLSPIDGVVMERRVDVGERLKDDTVAFVLVQTAPLKLRFRVPERYLAAVRQGQPVTAQVDPFPREAFTGRVTVVVDAVDPASRTFGVDAEFANRDGRLRPGLFARVELDLGAASREHGAGAAQAPSGGARAQTR